MAHSSNLAQSITQHIAKNGENYIKVVDVETRLLRLWLEHLHSYEKTGTANILIDGVSSAILEVAACLTAGFARVALGSIRAQIDLVLSWLYFKDHPIEWSHLEEHGDGFMQKSELIRYLGEKYSTNFNARLAVLKQSKTRRIEDPFSLLSAHLHKQSAKTVVSIESCSDVVCDSATCDDVVVLQASAAEYLNDVLLVYFSTDWAALPKPIIDAARARLSSAQEKVVFG